MLISALISDPRSRALQYWYYTADDGRGQSYSLRFASAGDRSGQCENTPAVNRTGAVLGPVRVQNLFSGFLLRPRKQCGHLRPCQERASSHTGTVEPW